MPIVFQERHGPISVTIEAHGAALALFSASERNTIKRTALVGGGVFWCNKFLGKRFSSYSFALLGYRVSNKWRLRKERDLGQAVPFVGYTPINGGNPPTWKKGKNGEKMMDAVQRGTKVAATATEKSNFIRITVPFGHPIPAQHSAAFRTLPAFEVGAVAGEVGRILVAILNGAIDVRSDVASQKIIQRTIVGSVSQLPPRNTGHGSRKVG